jgi:hypothetical protein
LVYKDKHLLTKILFILRIYPDQLAALGGLTAYPFAAQPQTGIRYITTSPHGLATGQPTGTYTIG